MGAGHYQYESCMVSPPDDCPDAHSGEQGNARVRYEKDAVPYGERCVAGGGGEPPFRSLIHAIVLTRA